MSFNYNQYLSKHKQNVELGFEWLKKNIPDVFENINEICKAKELIKNHDESKFTIDEYEAYEDFFYGSAVPEPEIRRAFDKAWLHHIHNNPHHWQYWVLINDDPEEGIKCLEIPGEYIIEMICDWWSFSWKANNLKLIFDWYNNHKDYMKINEKSKNRIEYILNRMSDELNKKES